MRKPTDQKEQAPSFFDRELKKTNEIINRSSPTTETETPSMAKSLEEWKKILKRNTIQRKKKDGTVFQEGFQISILLTRESDFEVLDQMQRYAEINCGGNVTLALMQLCKKGLSK